MKTSIALFFLIFTSLTKGTKMNKRYLKFIAGLAIGLAAVSTAFAQTAVVQSLNNLFNKAQTYRAAIPLTALASSPVDVFTVTGSASKTIYIKSITVQGTQTFPPTNQPIYLVKRSAANSGGTSTTPTKVALDSSNGTAAATVRAYTANATSSTGALTIGQRIMQYATVGAPVASLPAIRWDFGDGLNQYVVLRGTSQVLSVNLNAQTVTGGNLTAEIEWMEQ